MELAIYIHGPLYCTYMLMKGLNNVCVCAFE